MNYYYSVFLFAMLYQLPVYATTQSDSMTLAESPLSMTSLLQTILSLILVLVCIGVVAWLLKRSSGIQSSANGQLKIIAGLALGNRERAVLLQVGDEQLLIGVTTHNINLLHKLEKPLAVKETDLTADFSSKLRQFIKQQDKS